MSDLVQEFSAFLEHHKSTPGGALLALLDQMKPDRARHFRLCAIPHQFDTEILMVLAPDLSREAALKRCNELAEYPSVRVYGGKLYAINEDVRNRLFEQWLEPEVRGEFVAASERLVDYFSQGHDDNASADADSRRLNRMFHLIGANCDVGFSKFEDLFKQRRRSSLGECDVLIKLVHEYDKLLDPLKRASLAYQEGKLAVDRFQTDQGRKLFQSVLDTPGVNPELRTKTIVRLGLLESDNRNWSAAIARFKEALELTETIPDKIRGKELSYRIKLNLGVTYRDMGELQEAKHLLVASVREAYRIGHPNGMAMGFNSLGTLYRKIGEGKRAIKAYLNSLKLVELEDQPYRIAQVYNNLGLAYLEERQWKDGEEALNKSLAIKRKVGDTIGLGKTYNNLMQVFRVQKRESEAIEAGLKATQCFAEAGDYYDMGLATRNLGRLYRSLGKKQEAREYLANAVQLFERSQASSEALSLKEELRVMTLTRTRRMPWWAWILYISAALVVLMLILLLVYGVALLAQDLSDLSINPSPRR